MRKPVLPSVKFRHVVFPTEASRRRKVVNFGASFEAPPVPRAAPGPGLAPEDASFFRWLFGRTGLDARAYRAETLRRRPGAARRGRGGADRRPDAGAGGGGALPRG